MAMSEDRKIVHVQKQKLNPHARPFSLVQKQNLNPFSVPLQSTQGPPNICYGYYYYQPTHGWINNNTFQPFIMGPQFYYAPPNPGIMIEAADNIVNQVEYHAHYPGGSSTSCCGEAEIDNNNNNGNNKGAQEDVVEKQQHEVVEGGVKQGNNAQPQINGGNESSTSNKSCSDRKEKRSTPNINGSQRRKLKKKNKGDESAKTKGDNNAPAIAPASASKLTLKEYEEKVVVPKKKGLEAEKKSPHREDCERIKEFEAMQAIGKKKLEEEEAEKKSSAAHDLKKKSACQVNKKKSISINEFVKPEPIVKTQIININEPSRLKKGVEVQENGPSQKDGKSEGPHRIPNDGRFGGYHQSQSGGRFGGYQQQYSKRGGRFGGRGGYSQRCGRFEGQHQSQQTSVNQQPKASFNLAEFPPLGKS